MEIKVEGQQRQGSATDHTDEVRIWIAEAKQLVFVTLDMDLGRYIANYYPHLLTKEESLAQKSLIGQAKVQHADDEAMKEIDMTAQNPRWFPIALLLGLLYFLLGVGFATLASWAASNSTRVTWNRLGFLISVVAFALHIVYEHFRLRSSPLITATHVSIAVALGALALAVNANIHGYRVGSSNKRLLAIALVAWPAITAIPAFVVALVTASVLALRRRRPSLS